MKSRSNVRTATKKLTTSAWVKHQIEQLLRMTQKLTRIRHQEERVHQFRVHARRLETVFRLNRGLLQKKRHQKILKKIRSIRKRLGKVRERDVHIDLCNAWAKEKKYLFPVIQYLKKKRDREFKRVVRQIDFKEIKFLLKKLLGLKDQEFSERGGVDQVSQQVDRVFRFDQQYQRHHRMGSIHLIRVETKKIRYSLEALQYSYPNPWHVFVLKLKKMQGELGRMHDLETLMLELSQLRKKKTSSWEQAVLRGIQRMNKQTRLELKADLIHWDHQWPERKKMLISLRKSL